MTSKILFILGTAGVLALTELQNDRVIAMLEEVIQWLLKSPLPATVGVALVLWFQRRNIAAMKSGLQENTTETREARAEAKVAVEAVNTAKEHIVTQAAIAAKVVEALAPQLAGDKVAKVEIINDEAHPANTKLVEPIVLATLP